ncbi:hypothetical protein BDV98DRAFT_577101 [Pterulicium gracile]|uniref:Uncharacterized protein n=1 Tax=Pterulicium gracile TaxID=1884261 RepID=A0A5C3Q171_9AGAR|nr:hypothetical protein BDV98DRAFT_577101 [Pterula gracilis]
MFQFLPPRFAVLAITGSCSRRLASSIAYSMCFWPQISPKPINDTHAQIICQSSLQLGVIIKRERNSQAART